MFYLRVADKPADPDFVQAVVELYSNIFEYQARLICHLSQNSFKRGIRGTFELDDWGGMLKNGMSWERTFRGSAQFAKVPAHVSVLRFVWGLYINLRTSVSTAISELCCAPPWCAPPGLSVYGAYKKI